jgi:hypothetical protein
MVDDATKAFDSDSDAPLADCGCFEAFDKLQPRNPHSIVWRSYVTPAMLIVEEYLS